MMCPVCKRDLAPTLSICMACGAMVHDTVREELETKISRPGVSAASNSGRLPATPTISEPTPKIEQPKMDFGRIDLPKIEPTQPAPQAKRITPPTPPSVARQAAPPPIAASQQPATTPAPKPIAARFDTSDLGVKKTSPTLVEFQTKKATIPEWRLQLQNTVRQKVGTNRREGAQTEATQSQPTRTTSGANALKVEFVEDEQPSKQHQNPRVANALKRIEESRSKFSNQPIAEQSVQVGKAQPAARNYPFNVVARSNEATANPAGQKATVNPSPKPMLVSPLKIEKKGFDTNKLPPLSKPAAGARSFIPATDAPTARNQSAALKIEESVIADEVIEIEAEESDEIDDLAPFSMRFSSGLFDFIIGTFASLILLSPFMLSGGTWLSVSGFFAISAAVAIVMFLYLTISLAFFGRTFGMRLFSLELVDVEENAYPTMHQAAVSSAVFLLSLTAGGLGFLPMFFNEERRAAHDILSGTILIREY